jgi:hypothetical protein
MAIGNANADANANANDLYGLMLILCRLPFVCVRFECDVLVERIALDHSHVEFFGMVRGSVMHMRSGTLRCVWSSGRSRDVAPHPMVLDRTGLESRVVVFFECEIDITISELNEHWSRVFHSCGIQPFAWKSKC